MMREVRELEKEIFKRSFILSCLIFLLTILFKKFFFALGIPIGLVVAGINFHLLSLKVRKVDTASIQIFFLNYIFRYLIMASVLISSAILNKSLFFGTATGILIPQFVIFFSKWELSKSSK